MKTHRVGAVAATHPSCSGSTESSAAPRGWKGEPNSRPAHLRLLMLLVAFGLAVVPAKTRAQGLGDNPLQTEETCEDYPCMVCPDCSTCDAGMGGPGGGGGGSAGGGGSGSGSGGSDGGSGSPPSPSPIKVGADTSDPVLLYDGTYLYEDTDLWLPGRGFNFVFRRTYRSRGGPDDTYQALTGFAVRGHLGRNWDHSYNIWITRSGSSAYYVHTGKGRPQVFSREGGSGPLTSTSFAGHLAEVFIYDNTWDNDFVVLTQADGTDLPPGFIPV